MLNIRAVFLCVFFPLVAQAQHFVASSDTWVPFFMEKDGEHQGLGIDILEEIFAITGDTFSVKTLPMRRAEQLFEDGDVDLIVVDSPQWNDPNKSHHFVFSEPLIQVSEYVYLHKDSPISVHSSADLTDKVVSVRRGYRYPLFEQAFSEGLVTRHEVSSEQVLLKLLAAQRTDAIFMDSITFSYAMKREGIEPSLFVRGMELSRVDLAIKCSSAHKHLLPRMNNAIQQLKRAGTFKRLYQQYMEQ